MAPALVDFRHLDDLVDTLKAAGLKRVSVDPDDLDKLPGVWVQVTGIDHQTMGGYTFTVNLALMVNDKNPRRAMNDLAQLLNQVRGVLPNHGPALARTYLLPDNPSHPLPGLAVPFNLRVKGDTP